MAKTAIIIGAGVGGLATAALLGKAGYKVTVLEKNGQLGGVAGCFSVSGKAGKKGAKDAKEPWIADKTLKRTKNSFRFDMGPSWYLMPDIFEHFFELVGEDVNKHLQLVKLAPGYRVWYKDTFRKVDIHADLKRDLATVEQIEPGAGRALKRYLDQAAFQYGVAKKRFMYKNYNSLRDFMTFEMLRESRRLNMFSSLSRYAGKYFQTGAMQKLVLYPSLFLGSSPYKTPALYSMMSHADMTQGVYYPLGGMYEVVRALQKIGARHGVKYRTGTNVAEITVEDGIARGVQLDSGEELFADIVISNADIHHTETELLKAPHRSYNTTYWKKRAVGPSALVMHLGVKGTLPTLAHHNLLFSKDWRKNFADIFGKPYKKSKWPSDPSLYVCNPSKTDPSVAPKGYENLFVLVPVAAGLEYTDAELAAFSERTLETLEKELRLPGLRANIVYRRDFCVKDFASTYNNYRGSALGLAHTLKQTAAGRPANISKKVSGLYYVGNNTTPGIGLPSCLVSAELVYKRLTNDKSPGPLTKL